MWNEFNWDDLELRFWDDWCHYSWNKKTLEGLLDRSKFREFERTPLGISDGNLRKFDDGAPVCVNVRMFDGEHFVS